MSILELSDSVGDAGPNKSEDVIKTKLLMSRAKPYPQGPVLMYWDEDVKPTSRIGTGISKASVRSQATSPQAREDFLISVRQFYWDHSFMRQSGLFAPKGLRGTINPGDLFHQRLVSAVRDADIAALQARFDLMMGAAGAGSGTGSSVDAPARRVKQTVNRAIKDKAPLPKKEAQALASIVTDAAGMGVPLTLKGVDITTDGRFQATLGIDKSSLPDGSNTVGTSETFATIVSDLASASAAWKPTSGMSLILVSAEAYGVLLHSLPSDIYLRVILLKGAGPKLTNLQGKLLAAIERLTTNIQGKRQASNLRIEDIKQVLSRSNGNLTGKRIVELISNHEARVKRNRPRMLQYLNTVIVPALNKIGEQSAGAPALLLGTAIVETELRTRTQTGGGPGLSYYQVEPFTHRDHWVNYLNNRKNRTEREIIISSLVSQSAQNEAKDTAFSIFSERERELKENDVYATYMAYLRYSRGKFIFLANNDLKSMAEQWVKRYNRGGSGTVEQFIVKWTANMGIIDLND